MDRELFQIHCGKFEPDPGGNREQPSIWSITHGVFFFLFFFRVGKDALNCLQTQRIGFLANGRVSDTLRAFYIVVSDMANHGLCTLLILGTAFADRTTFANVTPAFVLSVAFAFGSGVV